MENSTKHKITSMGTITSFLTFNGNCREAMTFYKECLGGTLTFQTLGDSPLSEWMPKNIKGYILYSTLQNDNLLVSGSDMAPATGLIRGNNVALSLSCESEAEGMSIFQALAAGGTITEPLKFSNWGGLLSGVIDRYGNQWLINYHQKK